MAIVRLVLFVVLDGAYDASVGFDGESGRSGLGNESLCRLGGRCGAKPPGNLRLAEDLGQALEIALRETSQRDPVALEDSLQLGRGRRPGRAATACGLRRQTGDGCDVGRDVLELVIMESL